MKKIYEDIILYGTMAERDKRPEVDTTAHEIAESEILTMIELFPEMLEMLKELLDGGLTLIRNVGLRNKMFDIVAKAEGSVS